MGEAGAELVADVVPFEEMKLRMLNGSHSFLAYLGYLAGYQHINDCMQDDNYRRARVVVDAGRTGTNAEGAGGGSVTLCQFAD